MGAQSGLGPELETKTSIADHYATASSAGATSGEDLH